MWNNALSQKVEIESFQKIQDGSRRVMKAASGLGRCSASFQGSIEQMGSSEIGTTIEERSHAFYILR
mgnify:CR=1 FL=1